MSATTINNKQKIKVGINGFGRIGRLLARFCLAPESPLQLVHVNDIHGDASTAAYLLQFDSVHGRFVGYECKAVDNANKSQSFEVKGNGVVEQVGFSSHPKPDQVPWKDLGVSLVLNVLALLKQKKN